MLSVIKEDSRARLNRFKLADVRPLVLHDSDAELIAVIKANIRCMRRACIGPLKEYLFWRRIARRHCRANPDHGLTPFISAKLLMAERVLQVKRDNLSEYKSRTWCLIERVRAHASL